MIKMRRIVMVIIRIIGKLILSLNDYEEKEKIAIMS